MATALCAIGRFAREEDAPTMTEYALMVACVSLLVALSINLLGQICQEWFRDVSTVLSNA